MYSAQLKITILKTYSLGLPWQSNSWDFAMQFRWQFAPGWKAKISHASQTKTQNSANIVTNLEKTFIMVHIEK